MTILARRSAIGYYLDAACHHRAKGQHSGWRAHRQAWVSRPLASEVAVKGGFLVYRNRVETEMDLLVGKREDLLRRVDGR